MLYTITVRIEEGRQSFVSVEKVEHNNRSEAEDIAKNRAVTKHLHLSKVEVIQVVQKDIRKR